MQDSPTRMSDSDSSLTLKRAVVIDNGTHTCRAGFAGENQPAVTFRTLVGRTRDKSVPPEIHVGDEALSRKESLSIKRPVEYGLVTNWDDMEEVWKHTFSKLNVDPEEHPVLLTEPVLNPKASREKMTQLMFETFNCPVVSVGCQTTWALHTSGRKTGVVLNSGAGTTFVVPIYEGYKMPHAIVKTTISGPEITSYMLDLLHKKGFKISGCYNQAYDIARAIKETLCYVAYDFEHELKTTTLSTVERSYQTDDGRFVSVGMERFQCPEGVFQPLLMGHEMPGIHWTLARSIEKCDKDIHKDLYKNIQLSGGSTLFPGFPERLKMEIENEAPPETEVKVVPAPHGLLTPWIGGSMIAASSCFKDMSMSKDQYDEYGPSLVHMVCI